MFNAQGLFAVRTKVQLRKKLQARRLLADCDAVVLTETHLTPETGVAPWPTARAASLSAALGRPRVPASVSWSRTTSWSDSTLEWGGTSLSLGAPASSG